MFKVNKSKSGLKKKVTKALDEAIQASRGEKYSLGGASYKSIIFKLNNFNELSEMNKWFNSQSKDTQNQVLNYLANN